VLFDKHHKVILGTLTQRQAEPFNEWLLKELCRHWDCIDQARLGMEDEPEIEEILESAITRHRGDIKSIQQTRIKLRELFEL